MRILFQGDTDPGLSTESNWADWFLTEAMREIAGSRETAQEWAITGIVLAVLLTGVMLAIKWKLKERVGLSHQTWQLPKVCGFALLGLFPAFLLLLLIFVFSVNYKMILGWGGLFKGVLFEWVLYLVAMFIGDMAIRRFRTDYGW